MNNADNWIKELELQPHPEGGYFNEYYRSNLILPESSLPERYSGPHVASTSIYFLMKENNVSRFHKIKSDELWHFYDGVPVEIYIIKNEYNIEKTILGKDINKGEKPQKLIPAESWMAARPLDRKGFSLCGCTVSPGFEFQDFEMADYDELCNSYPKHKDIIAKFTPPNYND